MYVHSESVFVLPGHPVAERLLQRVCSFHRSNHQRRILVKGHKEFCLPCCRESLVLRDIRISCWSWHSLGRIHLLSSKKGSKPSHFHSASFVFDYFRRNEQ